MSFNSIKQWIYENKFLSILLLGMGLFILWGLWHFLTPKAWSARSTSTYYPILGVELQPEGKVRISTIQNIYNVPGSKQAEVTWQPDTGFYESKDITDQLNPEVGAPSTLDGKFGELSPRSIPIPNLSLATKKQLGNKFYYLSAVIGWPTGQMKDTRKLALIWQNKMANSLTAEGEVEIFNHRTKQVAVTLEKATGHDFERFVWSPDGNFIASVSTLGQLFLWDARTGYLQNSWSGLRKRNRGTSSVFYNNFGAFGGGDTPIAFSPDGRFIAATVLENKDGYYQPGRPIPSSLRLYSTQTGLPVASISSFYNWLNVLAWSQDGHLLFAAAANDRKLWAFDVPLRFQPQAHF